MRHHPYILGLTLPIVFGATGCSVVGKWQLSTIDPTAAMRDFEYHAFTLQKDGTFYGEAERTEVADFSVQAGEGAFRAEGQHELKGIMTTSGVYRYDERTLTLTPHEGKQVTYEARLIDSGNKLELEKIWKDRKVKAIFQRRD
jgi:hypothetical protein